jgi:flagellar biosynthetic protein FliO
MAPGLASADLFRMLGSFALVLALMAALLWALRKLQSRLNTQNSGRRMNVIESLSVGPRQKFALLRVGQHEVLVGIPASQMTALAHWPEGSDSLALATVSTPIVHATPTPSGEPHVA